MTNLSNTAESQRKKIITWLNEKSLTTVQARSELDIMMPAARIFELRQQGYKIHTHRETVETSKGRHERVARYVLLNEGGI